jgi:hypothetical protein
MQIASQTHLAVEADHLAAVAVFEDSFPSSLGAVCASSDLPALVLHVSRQQLCRLDLLPANLWVLVHLDRHLSQTVGQLIDGSRDGRERVRLVVQVCIGWREQRGMPCSRLDVWESTCAGCCLVARCRLIVVGYHFVVVYCLSILRRALGAFEESKAAWHDEDG